MQKQIKKIIPYLLLFLILFGLFSPMVKVNAQIQQPTTFGPKTQTQIDIETAQAVARQTEAATQTQTGNSAFRNEIDSGCSLWPQSFNLGGCLLLVFYYTYFQLPSLILWLSAQFFDVMINIGINSSVTSASGFIPAAWAVVRDFSNIFFILILLYVAIQTILGLGHETKKIIVRVIIIALLINFSMFFTKIVIDASNILALTFYNKLNVDTKNLDGTPVPKDQALQAGKNISGAMWKTFDATQLITPATITLLKTTEVRGVKKIETNLPFALTLGIMVIAGSIMFFAAYSFFIAGLMFIGRLIELWILIIFSPFAFMSWTLPKFAGIEYLGWDAWFKRLISTAFMAPIFMFFIYLIFMLLPKINNFTRGAIGDTPTTTILGTILVILIPAIILMAMLLKATHFAKKGGGQFGEMLMTGTKMVGGLALGAATGGAGFALRGTLGAAAMKTANNDDLRAQASGDTKHFARLGIHDTATQQKMQLAAQKKLDSANKTAGRSFDFRQTGVGKFAARKTGMDFGKGAAGGYREQEKEKAKAKQEKMKTYEMSGTAAEVQSKFNEEYVNQKNKAKIDAERKGAKFDEEKFKDSYETSGGRKVKTVEDINKERRKAYAISLDNASDKNDSTRTAMNKWWSRSANNFNVGAGKAINSTAFKTANALTLGTATALAPVVGALGGLVNMLGERKGGSSTNAEFVAMVGGKKIESSKDEALHHFQEAFGIKHGGDHAEEHKEKHEPAPAHTPPTPPSSSGSTH